MATSPAWTPSLRCSCGEKVMAVGLTPSELFAIVADDLGAPLCDAARGHPPAPTAAAGAAAAHPVLPPPPPPLLSSVRCSSGLDGLQQLAALMALQQEPSLHGLELGLEPKTPLMSERQHDVLQPSQSGRAGSTGSAGSGMHGGTQPRQGSPRCSLSTSGTSRFESVNRVATVAGKEYRHRRSGERQRRSHDREQRWSNEQPAAAAPSPRHPSRHSRLGGIERASQPTRQLQPPGRLSGGTAAQHLADMPLLPPEDASAEYNSSGLAAWLADSAAAAGGAAQLIGPDAVLRRKAPPASHSRSRGQGGSCGHAVLAPQPPAAAAAPLKTMLAPALVAAPPSIGGGSQAKASPALVEIAPPSMPDAPAGAPLPAVEPAAHEARSGTVTAPAPPAGKPPAKASCCDCSSDAGGEASCALLKPLILLARLLRF